MQLHTWLKGLGGWGEWGCGGIASCVQAVQADTAECFRSDKYSQYVHSRRESTAVLCAPETACLIACLAQRCTGLCISALINMDSTQHCQQHKPKSLHPQTLPPQTPPPTSSFASHEEEILPSQAFMFKYYITLTSLTRDSKLLDASG